jgi:hypothetical protein
MAMREENKAASSDNNNTSLNNLETTKAAKNKTIETMIPIDIVFLFELSIVILLSKKAIHY